MDKILIKDLQVQAIIGVLDHERTTPQTILINLTLYKDLQAAGTTDKLADSVSYSEVAERVKEVSASARRFTVEALAADIAELCLSEFPINKVRVRVEKPDAFADAHSVGVEILRKLR